MTEQQHPEPGAAAPQGTPKVEQVFEDPTLKQQAEQPGILEQIGHRLDQMLTSKSHSLSSYLEDIKLAYAMVRDPGFRIDYLTKIVVIIALLYLISPIDLLPDAIPVLGLLDDVLVIGYALKQAAAELERYRAWQQDIGAAQAQ